MLDRVRDIIVGRRSAASATALTLLAVAAATLLRWLLDRGALGVPFVTYFPVIMLAAVLLGWCYGLLAAIASLVAVRIVFLSGPWFALDPAHFAIVLLFAFTVLVLIGTAHLLREQILADERYKRDLDALNTEQQHRMKNSLQVLVGLIGRGLREPDMPAYYRTLMGRLDAWARANELLRPGTAANCDLGALVDAAMQAFEGSRIHAQGEPARLTAGAALPMALALHELATNATKYGALSGDKGTVRIGWSAGEGNTVVLRWTEQGGPSVSPPARSGLGQRILSPQGDLVAVRLSFEPGGVVCEIEARRG